MEPVHNPTDLPVLPARHLALFLDFDGTLVELVDRPEDVQVPRALPGLLCRLAERLDGALAIVTGRPVAGVDALLGERFAVAGVHGMQRRDAAGRLHELAGIDVAPVVAALAPFVSAHPGTLLETKPGAVALHYRKVPALGAACEAAMRAASQGVAGVSLLHGKMVIEAKPAGATKGRAIAAFMQEVPFAGRAPVFLGDDATDESGFEWVQAHGGTGVKVGAGPSRARWRVASPHDVLAWLERQACEYTGCGTNTAPGMTGGTQV